MYELVIELVGKGTRWEFSGHEIRIGRDPNCDLVLPSDEYPMVSRSHLLIRQAAERYWVEDLNTPGGTFVNGGKIQVSPLLDGDVLRLGADGPELRASIVGSYRLDSAAVPSRRQSSSAEAPTGLKKSAAFISSQEAPTGGKVMTDSTVEPEPQGSSMPNASSRKETPLVYAPVDSLTDAPDALAAGRDHGPIPTGEVPAFPHSERSVFQQAMAPDIALIERKLKTIRNLTLVAVLLTLIFGSLLIYHLWK